VHIRASPFKEMTPFTHIPLIRDNFPYTLTNWQWILAGPMFLAFKNQITERTSQSAGLVANMVFIKHCDTATNSLNGSANTGDVAEALMTALDLQKPLVNDLRRQGAQMVLTLKMTIIAGPECCTLSCGEIF
jgi:hypothetical protein